MHKNKAPTGLVGERTLRSMIKSIATKLKNEQLSIPETLKLLAAQERLQKALKQSAIARLEAEKEA